eukprot:COSAG01_NODE_1814_length_9172_cov_220.138212_8_plen_101_part_00
MSECGGARARVLLLLPGRRARSPSRCCFFLAAALTEIYLCDVCSCQDTLRSILLAAALTEIYLCDVCSCQDTLRSIAEQVAAHAERLSIACVVWGGDFNM